MKIKLTEKQITEQVKNFLEARGWTYIRLQSGLLRTKDSRFMRVGKAGLPDAVAFLGCHKRGYTKTMFLEFKRASGGRVSADQTYWHHLARLSGLVVLVVSDLDEFHEQYMEIFRPGTDVTSSG